MWFANLGYFWELEKSFFGFVSSSNNDKLKTKMLVTLYCSVISDYVRLDTVRVVSVCSSMWETTTRKIVKLVKLVKNCTKLQKIVR